MDRLILLDLIKRWQAPVPADEDTYSYYSEIAFSIEQQGQARLTFLSKEIAHTDTLRLQALLDILPSPTHPMSTESLLNYLTDERPLVVARAIDGLRLQEAKETLETILAYQRHLSPYVRGSVLRFVSR